MYSARFFNIQKRAPSSVVGSSHTVCITTITASCVALSRYMNADWISVHNSKESSNSSKFLSHNRRPIKSRLGAGEFVSKDGEVTQCTFVVKAQALSVLLPPVGCFLRVVENGRLNRIQQNPLAIYMSMISLGSGSHC